MIQKLITFFFLGVSLSAAQASSFEIAGYTAFKAPHLTPQKVPDAKCIYRTSSLPLKGSRFRISQFEVWTLRSGTTTREPDVVGFLKLRDKDTLRDTESLTIPMSLLSSGYVTDRFGKPKSISDTVIRKNLEIGGGEFHLVFKRTVDDVYSLSEPTVRAEMVVYEAKSKKIVLQSSCQYQKPEKK